MQHRQRPFSQPREQRPGRRRRIAGGVLAGVLALAATSCGGTVSEPEATGGDPGEERAAAVAQERDELENPGAEDRLAPRRIKPVIRPGAKADERLSEESASLGDAVRFSDGIEVEITDAAAGRATGRGIGAIAGPTTTFTVELRNNSERTVRLSTVVVTAVYGSPRRIARPVYDSDEQDLSGQVSSGGTLEARYTFSIPMPDLDDVELHVDFDSAHSAAVFTGTVR